MNLGKAKERLEILLKDDCKCPECMKNKEAYKTVLEELQNSIPKKKIEDKIKAYKKLIDDISESEQYSHEIPLYRHDIQVLQELLEDK